MENHPYGHNQRIPGQMPRQQLYNTIYPGMYVNQPPGAPVVRQAQQTSKSTPARMPKDRALALARLFKKALAVASIATFASLSGIVAFHQANASTSQKSATSTTTSSQEENNNPFFNQQGDDHLGTSTPTATATSNEPATTPTTTSGSSSRPVTGLPSGPNSGSHTS